MKKYIDIKIIIIILCVPIIVAVLTSSIESPLKNFTISNDWIGFFGSYIGCILGGLITLFVMDKTIESSNENLKKSIEENKKIQEKNEKNIFAMEITNLIGDYCSDISVYYYDSLRDEDYDKKINKLEDDLNSGKIDKREYYNKLSILKTDRVKGDRRKSITIYFKLGIMLKDKEEAKLLLGTLTKIHNEYCHPIGSNKLDSSEFEDKIEELLDETSKFIKLYVK